MIVISDLDGTLLDSSARLSLRNRSTLESLGDRGIVRVVATGRSLHSARLVLDGSFPIDYLVFSSGAGVVEWRSQRLMLSRDMSFEEAWEIAGLLMARRLDFMLHHGVPDNHHFFYYRAGASNPDFDARCARYEPYAKPLPDEPPSLDRASQLLAIEPRDATSQFDDLKAALPVHNVILTTSPLDHASRWIEIFPRTVSKAMASAWLCGQLGVDAGRALAVGNDFNDIELLEWAPARRVVANAPAALRDRYQTVVSNDADGFSEAVEGWLRG